MDTYTLDEEGNFCCNGVKLSKEILLKSLNDMADSSFKLQCLEDGGVDNWEWYSDSLKPYYEELKERKTKNV